MTITKIVWNGCDSYVEANQAASRGHQFDGETLFHGEQSFRAFDAVEIDPASLPKDEDGELVIDGIFGSESGKTYRAIS